MEQREVTVLVHEEDGQYWAEVPELPGCFAAGDTRAELAESLREALGLYLYDDAGRVRHFALNAPEPTERVEVDRALIAV